MHDFSCSILLHLYVILSTSLFSNIFRMRNKPLFFNNFFENNVANRLSYGFYGIDTLEVRCSLADLCFIFEIVNSMVDCPDILGSISFNLPGRITRGTPFFRTFTS
ncbi:hypothetical protein WA026_016274 [Henosepilachna vigintioctopunctata]|uniref:Secreted protein n=1 Tax=Henosepilachna vigintioctopunctata TaxID=420089 RepID=A0AAW1UJI2_9CUCU